MLALGMPPALLLAFVNYRRYWRALTVAGLALLGSAMVEFFPNAVLSGLHSRVLMWRYIRCAERE